MGTVQSRLSGVSPRSALSILGREALRIVLPAWCISCRRELPWQDRQASICADCWAAMPKYQGPKCTSCARPAPAPISGPFLCLACVSDPLPVEWCEAWGEYAGPLERALHALKFQRHDFLDAALASLAAECIEARGDLAFDAVVGVPMTRTRQRKRGYNQAALLAAALSSRLRLRCDMTLLRRRGERATQSTLPKRDRAANVRDAFVAPSGVKGQSILVVDDICTTGETLRACASALLTAGAARVCAVTVAKAS
jgi:ComF family protein